MRRLLVGFLIASLALPPAAAAQRGGVFVDPDSPAGTEYAIPLEQARRENSGSAETSPAQGARGGAAGQPLFGAGIGRAAAAPRADSSSSSDGDGEVGSVGVDGSGRAPAGGTGRGRGNADSRARPTGVETDSERRDAVGREAAAGGESDGLLTAGIAGSVLAVGLLIGFGLRRVLRGE